MASPALVAPTLHEPALGALAFYLEYGINKFYLLDYDGVLSPYGRNTLGKDFYNPDVIRRVPNFNYEADRRLPKTHREPKSYLDSFSTELAADLRPLFADPSALVIFVSTWRAWTPVGDFKLDAANTPFFLPWGYGPADNDHSRKVGAVANFLAPAWDAPGVKLVWADDIVLSDSARVRGNDDPVAKSDYMFRHFSSPDDVLLLAPDSKTGLSRADVDKLYDFAGMERNSG